MTFISFFLCRARHRCLPCPSLLFFPVWVKDFANTTVHVNYTGLASSLGHPWLNNSKALVEALGRFGITTVEELGNAEDALVRVRVARACVRVWGLSRGCECGCACGCACACVHVYIWMCRCVCLCLCVSVRSCMCVRTPGCAQVSTVLGSGLVTDFCYHRLRAQLILNHCQNQYIPYDGEFLRNLVIEDGVGLVNDGTNTKDTSDCADQVRWARGRLCVVMCCRGPVWGCAAGGRSRAGGRVGRGANANMYMRGERVLGLLRPCVVAQSGLRVRSCACACGVCVGWWWWGGGGGGGRVGEGWMSTALWLAGCSRFPQVRSVPPEATHDVTCVQTLPARKNSAFALLGNPARLYGSGGYASRGEFGNDVWYRGGCGALGPVRVCVCGGGGGDGCGCGRLLGWSRGQLCRAQACAVCTSCSPAMFSSLSHPPVPRTLRRSPALAAPTPLIPRFRCPWPPVGARHELIVGMPTVPQSRVLAPHAQVRGGGRGVVGAGWWARGGGRGVVGVGWWECGGSGSVVVRPLRAHCAPTPRGCLVRQTWSHR